MVAEILRLEFNPNELELFRAISTSVSEPFRLIANQFEKCFVSHLMKSCQKSIQLDSIHSASIRSSNPNKSETNFQSK